MRERCRIVQQYASRAGEENDRARCRQRGERARIFRGFAEGEMGKNRGEEHVERIAAGMRDAQRERRGDQIAAVVALVAPGDGGSQCDNIHSQRDSANRKINPSFSLAKFQKEVLF